MRHLYSAAKRNAKAALRNHWGQAIAITLFTMAISILFTLAETALTGILGLPGFVDYLGTPHYYLDNIPNLSAPSVAISALMTLAGLVITSPLTVGIKSWYFALTYGKAEDIGGIFGEFESVKRVLRAIWVRVLIGVRGLLWGILFLTPCGIMVWASLTLAKGGITGVDSVLAAFGGLLALALGLLGAALLWVFMQRYFLAVYFLALDKNLSAKKAIAQSLAATKTRRGEIALFELQFVGWYLLCVLLLPLLFVAPYHSASRALMARYYIERWQMGKDTVPAQTDQEADQETLPS